MRPIGPIVTEHDPGVTLLEVFAFLTEQLTFRSDQIPIEGVV